MDVRSEKLFGYVSSPVSAGDGTPYKYTGPEPLTSATPALMTMAELIRRMVTHITTPSAAIVSGGSAGSVAIAFGTATPSGIAGMFPGWPFVLSAAGTISGSPTSLISTASTTIRKVLVTIGMSAIPAQSSLGLAGGTVQFVYGSAYTVSAGAVTAGGQSAFFDLVPLPVPSANEIPVGWLNVYNSFATSAGIANTQMIVDYRATQGVDMSALLAGTPQP
jgi:hypothetical protein